MKTKRETVAITFKGQTITLPRITVSNVKSDYVNNDKYEDGIAYYQMLMDDEWERWERDATFWWWDRKRK